MNEKIYEYDEIIRCIPEKGGAYVIFPWNIREEFGRGRVKVHAEFDGQPYDGSIVNMGVKHEDGSVCYIIGITKAIRAKINKGDGDQVHVIIKGRLTLMPKCFIVHFTKYIDTGSGRMIQYSGGIIAGSEENVLGGKLWITKRYMQ